MAGAITVTSSALPLPLNSKVSAQPPASSLPLKLNRRLGTLTPVAPPVKRLMSGAALDMSTTRRPAVNLDNSGHWQTQRVPIDNELITSRDAVIWIGNVFAVANTSFITLASDRATTHDAVVLQGADFAAWQRQFVLLANAAAHPLGPVISQASDQQAPSAAVREWHGELQQPLQPAVNLHGELAQQQHGALVAREHSAMLQQAVPVPCRYYPIIEPPPPPLAYTCRIRPPSSRLPISLTRRRGGLPSSALPLALTCWHDQSPRFIPNLRSYLVHNVITATIGGLAVDLSGFGIKADMQGYCWQGSIDLPASQYARVKTKLATERGNEPLVIVTINGYSFAFIAEEHSRSRQFAQHSHSISGRSITARLGADYAHAQGISDSGMISLDSYASQIVQQQLANLPVSIDRWEVADWLIQAGSYSLTNKTPLAVIADIARACGGFVVSDASQARLSIKPRWKKPAWELATASPDVVIPMDVVRSISDKKDIRPRYNTVTLVGNHQAAEVYRNLQGRERIAPMDSNPLYSDRDAVVPAGIALLSDSGTHASYTLKMRWAEQYNVPLAELGHIWQINDPEGAWKGVVTSVAVSVDWDNNAPTVWQTVGIDRYLDA